MRTLLIAAAVALGLIAVSPASAGGYYNGYFYGYGSCPWIPWWSGVQCKPYAYRPLGYRYYAGSYDYVPGYPYGPRYRRIVIHSRY
jgi:hypothetical protein